MALAKVTDISAGDAYSCALLTGGAVKCWGRNEYGQLGDGTTKDRTNPVKVSGIANARSLALGSWGHSCALLTGGAIKCWGSNGNGKLGDGTFTSRNIPLNVSEITNATSLALGSTHSCALLTGGAIKCWGHNENGQIGDGTATDRNTPVNVMRLYGPSPSTPPPSSANTTSPPPSPPPTPPPKLALDDDDHAAGLSSILMVLAATTLNILFSL